MPRKSASQGGGAGGRGGAISLFITFLQGRRGVEIVLFWVRGGLTGRGRGKNNVIDFLKREGGEHYLIFREGVEARGAG